MTSDGKTFVLFLVLLITIYFLVVLVRAKSNSGVARVPSPILWFFLFGFNGGAINTRLIVIASDAFNAEALIAHERIHQDQMRKEGVLRFWWKYATDIKWRVNYELDAYREWVRVSPQDLHLCSKYLVEYDGSRSSQDYAELLANGGYV